MKLRIDKDAGEGYLVLMPDREQPDLEEVLARVPDQDCAMLIVGAINFFTMTAPTEWPDTLLAWQGEPAWPIGPKIVPMPKPLIPTTGREPPPSNSLGELRL